MNIIGRYTIKVVGWAVVIGATLAFIYHLWIFIGATIHAVRIGANSGTGLGQVFGVVGIIVFGGLILFGYTIIKKKL